jgi:hypothetical protein
MKKRYIVISDVYRRFAEDGFARGFDFSDVARETCYQLETFGVGKRETIFNTERNGYIIGKRLMDITIAMWKEDLRRGFLSIRELEMDWYPSWVIDKVR